MVRVALKHATVCALGSLEFLLLLIDVTNLEPNVLFCERSWRVGDNVFEALYHGQDLNAQLFGAYLRPDSG